MKIVIKSRHWKPSPTTRADMTERIEKLSRFYSRLIRAQLTVTREGTRHHAELHLHGSELDLVAKAADSDPRVALDQVLAKQERALRRRNDRLKDRKRRRGPVQKEVVLPVLRAIRPTNSSLSIVRERARRRVMGVEQAARLLMRSKKPLLVFEERGTGEVRVAYRRDTKEVAVVEFDEST